MQTATTTQLLADLLDPQKEEVWIEFDRRFRPVLLAYARRRGLQDADAAEAAQESLVAFVEQYRAGRFDRARGRLRSWLFAITRGRTLDLLRARARHAPLADPSALKDLRDPDRDEETWDEEWRRALLRQAVAELRASSRTDEQTVRVFEMLAFEERSAAEVAKSLDITTNAVYTAKSRMLDRLREILARLEKDT